MTWLTAYIILLFAIPSRLVVAPLGSAGAPSQILGLLSLLWWGWYQVSRWRGTQYHFKPIRAALGVFLLCIGISYITAMLRPIEADEVSTADVALIAAASWAGTFLVAHDGIPSRERLDVLIRRVAIAGGLLAIVGIVQFVAGRTLVDLISIPGLSANQTGYDFGRSGFTRPSGTATHPIEYGVVLTTLLPFALYLGLHGDRAHRVRRWFPAAAIAAIVPLSLSRSAIVGSVVGLAVLLPTWPPARRRLALIGIGALSAVIFVAVPGVLGSIVSLFTGIAGDPSARSRTDSYGIAWEFVARSPLFGRGLSTFLPKYWILDNQLLLLLITIGFVGLLAFLAIVVVAVLELRRLRAASTDLATRDLAQTLIASILTCTVCLTFFDGFAFPMTVGTLFLVLGMSGALTCLAPPLKDPTARTRHARNSRPQ